MKKHQKIINFSEKVRESLRIFSFNTKERVKIEKISNLKS